MVDRSGRDLHQNLGGGEGRAIRLTDKLYVQLAVSGDAELLDADGHLHSQRRFGDDRELALGLVRLADDRFGVLVRLDDVEPASYLVHVASVDAELTAIYTSSARYVAECP
jgi:hypothetical protein